MLIALNDIVVIIRPPKCSQLGRERDNSNGVRVRERTSAAHYGLMVGSNPFGPQPQPQPQPETESKAEPESEACPLCLPLNDS